MSNEDVVDYDSAEFDIRHGNEICLSEVDFDEVKIADEVNTAIQDAIHDFFSPEEENENED